METGRLEIQDGAEISSSTFSSGRGGNLTVTADNILLSGEGANGFTGIAAQASSGSSGNAGDIKLMANSLEVRDGAAIDSSTQSIGKGANTTIIAGNVILRDNGKISANSTTTGLAIEDNPEEGKSGSIFITVHDTFRLLNGSSVSVETAEANAGSIDVETANLIYLSDQSRITTSVADGKGSGGAINIDPVFVVLNDSQIVAQAAFGRGGNIQIDGDFIIKSADSTIDASSRFGIDGTVLTTTPQRDLQKGLVELPAEFFDASSLMQGTCEARHVRGESRFTQTGRGGLPTGADEFPPAFYSIDYQDSGANDDNSAEALANLSATRSLANLLSTQVMLDCGGHK